MKKLMLMFAVVASLMMASCSKSDRAADVAAKIENKQALDRADYTAMIEYLGGFAEDAQKYQDVIDNTDASDPKAQKAAQELADLRSSYRYLDLFRPVLERSTEQEVGADNVALVNKYAPLIWFNAPAWAVIDAAPGGTAGVIVDEPADSGAVIATGAQEVKVERN